MVGRLTILFLLLTASICEAGRHGNPQANSAAPLGINMGELVPGTLAQPFLNVFKLGGGWTPLNGSNAGTGEFSYLYTNCLDASGYPITLSATVGACNSGGHTFSRVSTRLMTGVSGNDPSGLTYLAGTYLLLYDGTCPTLPTSCFLYTNDAVLNSSIAGQDTLTVTPSNTGTGFDVIMIATGTGSNYIHNIRLVYGPYLSLLNGGENFNPSFIAKMREFRSVRFMQAQDILNASIEATQVNWSNRPPPNWVFWNEGESPNGNASPIFGGIPVEVMVALCNEINADLWIHIPVLATSNYVSNMAATALNGGGGWSGLNANLNVHVQVGNELWNDGNAGLYAGLIGTVAQATFPSVGQNAAVKGYVTYLQVVYGDLWKSTWGAQSGRVKNTFGGFTYGYGAGNYNLAQLNLHAGDAGSNPSLWTGAAYTHIDEVAVAPYFGDTYVPTAPALTAQPDGGMGLLFQELQLGGTLLPDVLGTGNCGAGAGITCTTLSAADTATLSAAGSGYTNGAQVLTIAGGTCTTQPTVNVTVVGGAVSSVGSVAVQGSCSAPPANPATSSGAGGAGATFNVTYGALAYSFASSAGNVPATPANGTQIVIKMGANSEPGATLTMDGGTAYPLTNYLFNNVGAAEMANNQHYLLLFTNAVANFPSTGNTQNVTITCGNPTIVNWPGPLTGFDFQVNFTGTVCTGLSTATTYFISAGPNYGKTTFQIATTAGGTPATSSGSASGVTATVKPVPTWQYVNPAYPGGAIKQPMDALAQNFIDTNSLGLVLVGYEGGQSLTDFAQQSSALEPLYEAANRDYRMAQVMAQWGSALPATGITLVEHYADFGTYNKFGYWGIAENVLDPISSKEAGILDFTRRVPCWWTGCRH